MFSYYNINSLRNKFIDLNEIVSKSIPDVLVFAETKLDNSFSDAQFYMENYYKPTRKDQTCNNGGLIEYIKKGVIRKNVPKYELKSFASIASELTICKNKWLLISFYRTEGKENKLSNIKKFFQETSDVLNNAIKNYDNIILMGDININTKKKKAVGFKDYSNFIDSFGFKNLINENTCFFKGNESSIDVLLTNQPRKFYGSKTFELGISDCHKMISSCLRSHVPRIKSKTIKYRSFKNFDTETFLKELGDAFQTTDFIKNSVNESYENLINQLISKLDKYAPLKTKKVRGNQSRFMNKELSKAIMKRSQLKSKYLKNKNSLNRSLFKKQRNLCVTLKRKAIKEDFDTCSSQLNKNSKLFYDLIKPYLTNKGALCSNDITLLENDELISDESKQGDIFNDYFTNIVEYSSGKKTSDTANTLAGAKIDQIIDVILDSYKNHPSVLLIKGNTKNSKVFKFRKVTEAEVKKVMESLDCKKAIGFDSIPAKILKESIHILVTPLTSIINQCIEEQTFPSSAKIATIFPSFKKLDRLLKCNYRPISVLSAMSKIFERILKDQIMVHMDTLLSPYVSAYRKNYSSQHVLIRLLEEWRKGLDEGSLVGAILMDLSKAFDCIPHDLLIAKLYHYGFSKNSLKLIYSYLKGRRQCVKINNTESKFLTILAGVPQGSILGPILFNIFINDLNYEINMASLHGFADDHSISAQTKSLKTLKQILVQEAEKAIDWLTINNMMANPSKFQLIILSKNKEPIITTIKLKGKVIKSQESVVLLGITFDHKLKFYIHIKDLCQKASGQLNALFRLKSYLSHDSKKLSVNSFILSNFNYCPLIWHFSDYNSKRKIESIQKRAYRFIGPEKPKCSMEIKRLKSLAIEIFKTKSNLNPSYMKEIFKPKSNTTTNSILAQNLLVQKHKQVKYGRNSLRVLGPILWNCLPIKAKSIKCISEFKKYMESWGMMGCKAFTKFQKYLTAIK